MLDQIDPATWYVSSEVADYLSASKGTVRNQCAQLSRSKSASVKKVAIPGQRGPAPWQVLGAQVLEWERSSDGVSGVPVEVGDATELRVALRDITDENARLKIELHNRDQVVGLAETKRLAEDNARLTTKLEVVAKALDRANRTIDELTQALQES